MSYAGVTLNNSTGGYSIPAFQIGLDAWKAETGGNATFNNIPFDEKPVKYASFIATQDCLVGPPLHVRQLHAEVRDAPAAAARGQLHGRPSDFIQTRCRASRPRPTRSSAACRSTSARGCGPGTRRCSPRSARTPTIRRTRTRHSSPSPRSSSRRASSRAPSRGRAPAGRSPSSTGPTSTTRPAIRCSAMTGPRSCSTAPRVRRPSRPSRPASRAGSGIRSSSTSPTSTRRTSSSPRATWRRSCTASRRSIRPRRS